MAVAKDALMLAGNSSDGFNQEASGVTTISSTGITVGGSATLLVVVLVFESSSADISSLTVTWNGVSMTSRGLVSSTSGSQHEQAAIFTLVNPASGAKTLQANWTTSADCYMSAVSFTGTDTTTGVKAADNTTATNVTSITVTSATGDATVAVFGVNGNPPTCNFTKIFSEAPLNPGGGASYQLGGTSNAHTFTGAGGSAQALAGVHVIQPAGGTAYTLSGSAGSFTLTGKAMTFSVGRPLSGSAGSFTLTGKAATFSVGRPFSGSAGSFTLSGKAATFSVGRPMSGSAGSFTLSGKTATLNKGLGLSGSAGAFTLTGKSQTYSVGRNFSASPGAFVVSGQVATTSWPRHLAGSAGSYTVTGAAAAFARGKGLAGSAGSFTLTGRTLTVSIGRVLSAARGSFTVTGKTGTLLYTSGVAVTYLIEEALTAYLGNDTAIVAAMGGAFRFSPTESLIGQSYPRITYTLDSDEDEYTTTTDTSQPLTTLTLSCWAKGSSAYSQAWALAKLVRDSKGGQNGLRLKEFRGVMAHRVWVQSSRLAEEYDAPQSPFDGGEKSVQCVNQTYEFSVDYLSAVT